MKASEFISSLFFLFSVFSFKMLFGRLDDRRSKSIRLVTSGLFLYFSLIDDPASIDAGTDENVVFIFSLISSKPV